MIAALVILAAAPAADIRLAAPGLSSVHVKADAARFYSDHLAQKLTEAGLHVVTATEMGALLGVERQRQLLGCSGTSESCMTELSGALGVDGLVTGSVGEFDGRYQLNISVLSARGQAPLATWSAQVRGEAALVEELDKAARELAPQIAQALGRPMAGSAAQASHRAWALLPAIAGAAFAVASIPLLVMAKARHDALTGGQTIDPAVAADARSSGPTLQALGDVALAVGAVGLAAAVLTFVLGGPSSATVAVVPRRDGAAFTLEVQLP